MTSPAARAAKHQLLTLRAEATRYKTVRVDWLVANLDRIMADPFNFDEAEEGGCASYQDPIGTPKRPEGLVHWLARHRGLMDHGDLRAMDAHKKFVPGCGKLVRREGGWSLDYAREAAIQEGYLPQDADINTLLDAINDELHGRPVYPMQSAGDLHDDCPF